MKVEIEAWEQGHILLALKGQTCNGCQQIFRRLQILFEKPEPEQSVQPTHSESLSG